MSTAIAAMAAVTERLRFATSVYILPLRSPFQVAKTLATAAVLSGNRVVLGTGAGWMREEFDIMGVDFKTRGKRFDESIEVCRKLWKGGMVEHHGEFFDFPALQMAPAPTETVPVWIGGVSNVALRRAGTIGDGWLGSGQTPEEGVEMLSTIAEHRKAAAVRDALIGRSGPRWLLGVGRLRFGSLSKAGRAGQGCGQGDPEHAKRISSG